MLYMLAYSIFFQHSLINGHQQFGVLLQKHNFVIHKLLICELKTCSAHTRGGFNFVLPLVPLLPSPSFHLPAWWKRRRRFYANTTEEFSRVEYLNLCSDCRRDAGGKTAHEKWVEPNRWRNLLSISSSISRCPAPIRAHLFSTPAKNPCYSQIILFV